MNPERVLQRGLRVRDPRGARLPDFRLAFDKMSRDHDGVGHANIHFARGQTVEGVLYELHEATEILKMDPFEKAPWNYGRDKVRVITGGGEIWAWTYFANPAVRVAGLRPTSEYLSHLLAGRRFLSEQYLRQLLSLAEQSAP